MKIRCMIALLLLVSCEILDNDPEKHVVKDQDSTRIDLEEVARMMSALPLSLSQFAEVHSAVTSSSGNGYDEEYTMKNLFTSPGAGVGEERGTRSHNVYERPLRDLIGDYVRSYEATRSSSLGKVFDPDAFLRELERSNMQIYWPFSGVWDGRQMPVITFDPEDGSSVNVGYVVSIGDDGSRRVEEVIVDEEMARERPVWVINRNTDAGYDTLEMLRRENPDWGEGGGSLIVKPQPASRTSGGSPICDGPLTSDAPLKMLVLKQLTAKRNYDSWFAGASEFFVKIASLDDFTASTEAELRLYDPMITDFMLVVKRGQVGEPQDFNVLLVSEMLKNTDEYAFMITEDDGGTREDWNCKGKVFISGKSYGIEVTIPMNRRDDIVWRGMLSARSLEKFNNKVNSFGDIDLVFEIVEY